MEEEPRTKTNQLNESMLSNKMFLNGIQTTTSNLPSYIALLFRIYYNLQIYMLVASVSYLLFMRLYAQSVIS